MKDRFLFKKLRDTIGTGTLTTVVFQISTKKAMHWRLGPADHYDTIPYTGNLNRSVAVRFDFDNTVLYDFDMDRDTQEEMVKSADEVSCRTHRFRFCSLDRPSIG